jgi:hypothetical protein
VDDWIYWRLRLIYTTRNYIQLQGYRYSHTLQFTMTHALGFSVFTCRILAMDLEQSRCHFKSRPKSFLHSLIPLLPLFCSCQFRRLDSIQFLCSQTHIPASWRPETRLFTAMNGLNWILLYNHFARTTQKTQPLYCWEDVYTAQLHSNGSYSIFSWVFVAAGICLPRRCLAIYVYSDLTIPAFGRHVTILCCDRFLPDPFQFIIHLVCYLTIQRSMAFDAEKWREVILCVGCGPIRERTRGTQLVPLSRGAKLIPRVLRYSCHATGFHITRIPNCVYLHSKLIK